MKTPLKLPATINIDLNPMKGNSNQKLQPLSNYVVVEMASEEEQQKLTDSKIIQVVDVNYPPVGIIIAAGPGQVMSTGTLIPLNVSVGQKVLFDMRGAVTVAHEGKECFLLQSQDIKAIVS